MGQLATRAQWFAELAETIEDAQRLAWLLGTRDHSASDEARDLYGRLEAARLELDALREAADVPSQDGDPEWLRKLGWSGALKDPAR